MTLMYELDLNILKIGLPKYFFWAPCILRVSTREYYYTLDRDASERLPSRCCGW